MIRKKTLLILGAGASYDYGFPTGDQLTETIHNRLTLEYRDIGPILEELGGYTQGQLYEFQDKIRELDLPTLDRWIQNHDKDTPMAKAVIATALIPYEKDEAILKPPPPRKHWYRALFQQMLGDSSEDFKSSAFRLPIVTFNYDRSLEYYFFKALKNSFDERQAIDMYKHLSITHVYGSLGKPHFVDPADVDSRPFGPAVTKEAIQKCMNTMKLVVEAGMPNSFSYIAGDLFLDVQRICFLGFGYDSQNIRRLVYDKNHIANREIYRTAYHLPESKKRQVAEEIPGIKLGGWDDDVLTFLDHTPVLD